MAFGFGTNIAKELIFSGLGGRPKGKPDIPEAPRVDIDKVLTELVSVSKGKLPDIMELVSSLNQFIGAESMRLAETFAPGFAATQAAQMGAARDLSEGRLPEAVQRAIRSEGAARNISTGTLSSARVPEGFANFGHLFRTGQEALGGIGFGSQLASQATQRGRAFAPDFASPLSFLFSPTQAAELERFNELSRFDVESAKNLISWLPSQRQAALAGAVAEDFDQTISTVASAYTGGALGGMGSFGGGGGTGGLMSMFGMGGQGGTEAFKPNYG